MSFQLSLTLAVVLLFIVAAIVIGGVMLSQRPRDDWQESVRRNAEEVRKVGLEGIRQPSVTPKDVSFFEVWQEESEVGSAYMGVPRKIQREEVLEALSIPETTLPQPPKRWRNSAKEEQEEPQLEQEDGADGTELPSPTWLDLEEKIEDIDLQEFADLDSALEAEFDEKTELVDADGFYGDQPLKPAFLPLRSVVVPDEEPEDFTEVVSDRQAADLEDVDAVLPASLFGAAPEEVLRSIETEFDDVTELREDVIFDDAGRAQGTELAAVEEDEVSLAPEWTDLATWAKEHEGDYTND